MTAIETQRTLAKMLMAATGIDPEAEVIGVNWGSVTGPEIHLHKYKANLNMMRRLAAANDKPLVVTSHDDNFDRAAYEINGVEVFALIPKEGEDE